ncbi:hypothetical protein [Mucilaginibacter sp.]|jgi:hypothetical protein|uniref:hypothetical protein n=1 Tax=Mucilaginibacter sp. TaxID=1882438 RepID=UPI003563DF8C
MILKRLIFFCLISLTLAGKLQAQSAKWKLKDFAIDLNKLVTLPSQLWVGSGYTTVSPVLGSVMGTADVMSPPISGRNFSFKALFVANGDTIRDQFVWGSKPNNVLYTGGNWQPDQIIRRGIYHRMHAGGMLSFEIISHLIPFADKSGFMIRYEVINKGDQKLTLTLVPLVNPGKPSFIALNKWGFTPPAWGYSPAPFGFSPPADTIKVKKTGNNEWATEQIKLKFFQEGNKLIIDPAKKGTGYVGVVFADKAATLPEKSDFLAWENNTNKIWANRLQWALGKIPTLKTTNSALENYYKRSIISGLVCIWEKPDFKLNPTVVTSGLDGGSMTTYLWDVAGYAPNLMTLMMGDKILNITRNMTDIDLEQYNAFTPDGAGSGVRYAYSTVSFATLVYAIACQDKIYPDLFEQVKRLVLKDEERPMVNGIVDYGEQKNLLEMRGMGYEHMVPSPNSERVWNFRKLAEMGQRIGYDPAVIDQWKKKSTSIAENIRKELWDNKAGWFYCKYPNGHKELVYSIQVFDMLRSGVCTPYMKQKMMEQLVEHKFLFPYGVSSISKADSLHYEVTDTDWGGGGAYTGDVAQLALDLYHEHVPGKAWDVLQRQFWLGELWPYFPQEHFCDRPASPVFKRANIVAGLTGAEAILYGLIGLDPRLDGSLWINPQAPSKDKITIKGYGFRKHLINVVTNQSFLRVEADGKLIYEGKPKLLKVL